MKPSIIVVGSSNTDMIIRVPHLPRPGETVLGGQFLTAAGGKGANQAVAAARAGGAVTFLARVGQDLFGDQAIRGFIADGINVDQVKQDRSSPSGVALIFVAQKGQNSIAVALGANALLSTGDVRRARAAFRKAHVLLTQLETPLPTVLAACRLARAHGLTVILNPAPARPLSAALLKLVTILTPNESEAEVLTGIRVTSRCTAARAAQTLLRRGVQTVIITLGEQGAFVATADTAELIPAFRVKPVDTTAAGDVFNGALAVALGEGRPLMEAVRVANAAAALSVTRPGAQPSAPRRREIEKLAATSCR